MVEIKACTDLRRDNDFLPIFYAPDVNFFYGIAILYKVRY